MKGLIANIIETWYLPFIVGALYFILGVWIIFTPIKSFFAFVLLIGVSISVAAFLELIYLISNRKNLINLPARIISGLLSLLLGVFIIINPWLSIYMLSVSIGSFIFVKTIIDLIIAFKAKSQGNKERRWILIIGGLGIIISILLIWSPTFISIAFGIWIGIGLIIAGVIRVLLSMVLQRIWKYSKNYLSTNE